MPIFNLEIACFNIASARVAAKCGVSRIELCANAELGGTTPDIDAPTLQTLKAELEVPIFIMIRPRGGDFVYTEAEFETMRTHIRQLRDVADGFVFGMLDMDNRIDVTRNRLLVEDTGGKPCTLHRAFDQTPNLIESLQGAIECGFLTILTSGGADTAFAGTKNLKELVHKADGKINIMPGGGVRSGNAREIKRGTRAIWFHSAAKTNPNDIVPNVDEIMTLKIMLEG